MADYASPLQPIRLLLRPGPCAWREVCVSGWQLAARCNPPSLPMGLVGCSWGPVRSMGRYEQAHPPYKVMLQRDGPVPLCVLCQGFM